MLTTAATLAAHAGPWAAGGFPWLALVIPLFWIAFFIVIAILIRRGVMRRPYLHGAASAEQVLGTRFANGDIDEQEYRARLEVLRAHDRR